MPIGKPVFVIPTGKLMPGMPPTLPGLVLRMKVGKVGNAAPLSMKVSSSPIFAAGAGRRREDDGRDAVLAEMAAIGVLKHCALLQRFAIGLLRHGARTGEALQDSFDVRACALGHQPA